MQNSIARLLLTLFLSWQLTDSTAQSLSIDSIITASSLKALVQTLAADSFQGRLAGTPKAVQTAEFISETFKLAGVLPAPENKGYLVPFQIPIKVADPGTIIRSVFNFNVSKKVVAYNVVAALPGSSKATELIIFSAHYDHVGSIRQSISIHPPERGEPEKGDETYNGANDNASGISGLIHLARYFAQQPNRERTILFIAFSGEEEGLFGSKALVKTLDAKAIKAVINMDMIGRPIANDKKFPYITGDTHSNLLQLLNKKLFETAPQYGDNYFQGDQFSEEHLYKRSDNYPFARKGITAHTILTSSPYDIYYHSLNDEWETLDYPFMAEVVKAIALATSGLVDGSATPK